MLVVFVFISSSDHFKSKLENTFTNSSLDFFILISWLLTLFGWIGSRWGCISLIILLTILCIILSVRVISMCTKLKKCIGWISNKSCKAKKLKRKKKKIVFYNLLIIRHLPLRLHILHSVLRLLLWQYLQ